MYIFEAINSAGDILPLMPSSQYTVRAISGLLPNSAAVYSSDIAGGDGAIYNSSRVETRNIVLQIHPEFPVELNRINLYSFFKLGKPVDLHFKNGSRDVKITGYVENFDGSLFDLKQLIQISILCPQPFFKSAQSIIDQVSEILNLFEFPFDIENTGIPFSEINTDRQLTIINTGEVDAGVIITLHANGNVKNPVVYDVTNNAQFSLTVDMELGDEIIINTNRGNKGVYLTSDNVRTNIINAMTLESTFFTVPPGETVFTYNCAEGADNLQVTFEYYNQYQGV